MFQKITKQPLFVLIGVGLDQIYHDYYHRQLIYILLVAGISAALILLAYISYIYILKSSLLNRDLDEKNKLTEQINNNQKDFILSISHELRTPLNGIMGYAEYIHYTAKEPLIKFPAQIIFESSNHLLSLVNTMLDLNRIELGTFKISPSYFDLRSELKSICNTQRSRTVQKNINLVLEIDENIPPIVFIDQTLLRQILNNLLDNAIKFSKEAGKITMSALYIRNLDSIYFSVKDNGIGIPESMHSQVFNKFWQNDEFITRNHGGTGLGLALVQKLVSLMGGEINFNSSPDVGSYFYFTLKANSKS